VPRNSALSLLVRASRHRRAHLVSRSALACPTGSGRRDSGLGRDLGPFVFNPEWYVGFHSLSRAILAPTPERIEALRRRWTY
jgi:hypothetical protein